MKDKIINKIKKILGISKLEQEHNLLNEQIKTWSMIGVDLGVEDESFIVIATRLNGGMVKVIRTRFNNMTQAIEVSKFFEERYGIKNPIKDYPKFIKF